MVSKTIVAAAAAAAIGLGAVVLPSVARADGIFDLMNPFEWFFGDDDWDDWRYRSAYGGGPYGWGGPHGWGGPYGYGAQQNPRVVVVMPETAPSQTAPRLPE
jgi:hypothetical protein